MILGPSFNCWTPSAFAQSAISIARLSRQNAVSEPRAVLSVSPGTQRRLNRSILSNTPSIWAALVACMIHGLVLSLISSMSSGVVSVPPSNGTGSAVYAAVPLSHLT